MVTSNEYVPHYGTAVVQILSVYEVVSVVRYVFLKVYINST